MQDAPTAAITVVTGLPRSGTSLMMQMLAAGGVDVLTDGLRAPDRANPRGYFELEAVKRTRSDCRWVPAARGRAVKIVYRLLGDLPCSERYRVLFMERPLAEVFASQQAMLEQRGAKVECLDLEAFERVFGAELSTTQAWLRQQPHFAVLPVAYHQLLDDPPKGLTAMSRFLGVPLDVAAMAGAIDPALYRQRGASSLPCA